MKESMFSEQNQPDSVNVATKRLNWLREKVRQIYSANNFGDEKQKVRRDNPAFKALFSSEEDFDLQVSYNAEIMFLKVWIIESILLLELNKIPKEVLEVSKVKKYGKDNPPQTLEQAIDLRKKFGQNIFTLDTEITNLKRVKEDLIKNIFRQMKWAKASHVNDAYIKIADKLKAVKSFYLDQMPFLKEWVRKEKDAFNLKKYDLTSHQNVIKSLIGIIQRVTAEKDVELQEDERNIFSAVQSIYL